MLAKMLIAFALLLIAFVIVVALRPADFRVTRSAVMPALPEVVFPHVNDLHLWQEWSPWARMDPNCQVSFAGPPAGVGANFKWAGNNQVGTGGMTVTESRPNELVRFRLDFQKPMTGTCIVDFTFQPQAGGTLVTWTMTGHNNFAAKAFGLFVNCDEMCGKQFEQGFANLKATLEGAGAKITAAP